MSPRGDQKRRSARQRRSVVPFSPQSQLLTPEPLLVSTPAPAFQLLSPVKEAKPSNLAPWMRFIRTFSLFLIPHMIAWVSPTDITRGQPTTHTILLVTLFSISMSVTIWSIQLLGHDLPGAHKTLMYSLAVANSVSVLLLSSSGVYPLKKYKKDEQD